ncbi:hypothetical protein [Timonella senegalensis]|uniref:hypothetical protein n=1 Tax=Timonella senegalensis TaxID=1465825 RepID=UPI002FDDB653
MMTFVLWTVLVVCMAGLFVALGFQLWGQLKALLSKASRAGSVLGEAFGDVEREATLRESGKITEPRDVDAFAGPGRKLDLKAERRDRKDARAQVREANRRQTYDRWRNLTR